MLRRWRSPLLLWLALCLPLQGFAAVSGLWCAKMGFHAPTWVAPAGQGAAAHHVPHAAHHTGGHGTTPWAADAHTVGHFGEAIEGLHDDAATVAPAEASAPAIAASTVDGPPGTMHAAAAADPSGASCAQCAGCHACAMLPCAAPPAMASAPSDDPVRWVPAGHSGPWPQALERPPRTLPR